MASQVTDRNRRHGLGVAAMGLLLAITGTARAAEAQIKLVTAKSTPANAAPANPSPARPAGHPGDWISDNDYPSTSLQHNSTGIVGFVLTVDPAGVPSGCEIAKSSSDPDLDKATCDLLIQRARFIPATDAKGKPTTGSFRSSVRWQIPNDPEEVPASGKLVVAIDVLPDGAVTNCVATASGSILAKFPGGDPQIACKREFKFQPPLDASGNPAKKHIVYETVVTVTDVP